MRDVNELWRFADAVISMIREDQESGQIPPDVLTIDELDAYVDIDDYYRRVGLPIGNHDAAELRYAVGEEIGKRLAAAQGGPWHAIWRPADGKPQDIGRTVGYATRAEAQAIGREHVHTHGGAFHLRKS
jgi:hypothetical protein